MDNRESIVSNTNTFVRNAKTTGLCFKLKLYCMVRVKELQQQQQQHIFHVIINTNKS